MKELTTSSVTNSEEDYSLDFDSESELERLQSESLFGPVTCGMIFGYFLRVTALQIHIYCAAC